MKRIGPVLDVLVCVVFVVVCPILASTSVDKDEHGDAYTKKTEDASQTTRNSKDTKLSAHRDAKHDLTVKSGTRRGEAKEDNSALGRFLEDVLRAQSDLKWIDQAVRGVNPRKDWEKSPSARANKYSESSHKKESSLPVSADREAKLRKKRDFDQNYEPTWTGIKKKCNDKRPDELPQRVYLDSEIPFKRLTDFDYLDGANGKEAPSLKNKAGERVYDKATMDDQIPKDWTKTEDICSLNDWLNSKERETEQEKQGDRWTRDYETGPSDHLNSNAKVHDTRDSGKSQRDKVKKDEAPTLESLKETVLELKKSLNEAGKKLHEDSKNVESTKIKEESKESKERRTRGKNKHKGNEKDEKGDSSWWEASGPENVDLKKREEAGPDLDEKNDRLKVWRTKRTGEVNNGDGNPKLFHRAGFGEPYPEEETLKELHDRKRRSKGPPSDEKRYLNEAPNKGNLETDDRNLETVSKEPSCSDTDDSAMKKSSSNDSQGTATNDVPDSSKEASAQKEENRNADGSQNCEQSDLSQKDSNTMGNKLTKEEGNLLPAFGSMPGESQPVPRKTSSYLNRDDSEQAEEARAQKMEESQKNVGSDKGEQVNVGSDKAEQANVDSDKAEQANKIFEPEPLLDENGERGKEAQRIEQEERDPGKLSRQVSDGQTSAKGTGTINILLESEKDLIKFSNTGGNDRSFANQQQPFLVNRFDVKKKLIMENEEQPGKSMSTILNVKIEKAQVDTPVKAKRENRQDGDGAKVLDPGKNKPNEGLYKEAAVLGNDLKQRNGDEERLKNSAEFDKGSAQSGDNEGERNWYEGVARNQMGTSIDQSGAEKYKEEGEKEKFGNEEERFRDGRKKGESVEVPNDGAAPSDGSVPVSDDKVKDDKEADKKRLKEVFIMNDGMDDRYVQRRILQYMEYSNDDVEDADMSYSDKEEEDNPQAEAAVPEESDVAKRKGRSPSADASKGNPMKAKLNVLIKEKIDEKQKKTRRKRRNSPTIIEYYDYDSDMAPDHDTASAISDQEPGGQNYDQNAVESNPGLAESMEGSPDCPPINKKNEHEEEMLKQERKQAQMKNKDVQEQFIPEGSVQLPKNVTGKTDAANSSRLSSKAVRPEEEGSLGGQQPGRLDQGEDKANSINQGRLNRPIEGNEEKLSEGGAKGTMAEGPEKCVLEENLDPGVIDDFFEDIRIMDPKNQEISKDVEPLYEELKKLYDWSDSESKNKPRIKGDQRMYYGADDKEDSSNTVDEFLQDQIESPEVQGSSESSDSRPNLLPLLLVHDQPGGAEIAEKPSTAVSSEQPESSGASNVSQSNYFALKSTDDMFKGGSEQSNSTGLKLRGASPIGTAVEWPTQKVNGVRNEGPGGKDPASWSLTDRRQYVDTDSRSPYENRKYVESQLPRERVQNIDRGKQMVISSMDLHESFVEPLDWLDDFDKDIRVRLSRGLKTVEDMSSDSARTVPSNVTKREETTLSTLENSSTGNARASSKSPNLELDFLPPSSNIHNLPGKDSVRVRREADVPYETYYDDIDEHQQDSERMDYNQYSRNGKAMDNRFQLLNSYGDEDGVEDIRHILSKSHTKVKGHDSLDDDDDDSEASDKEVVRSTRSKKEGKRKKKEDHYRETYKKQKRKSHGNKRKYPASSRRKRRHHKKHSVSKAKSHEDDEKKHKKRVSKNVNHHTSAKKSKTAQNEGKVHEAPHGTSMGVRKVPRGKTEHDDTMNSDDDFHGRGISMLLAADDIEDESQMDSALHGELAGKIVEQIFEQVQKNEVLKVSLAPGLHQRHKTEDAVAANKRYRQAIDDDEIKHTEELLQRVMLLLNRLIFDEVQRKTCVSVPPDLIEFLDWMLDVNVHESSMEQVPSLPLVHEEDAPGHFPQDKFLFQSSMEMETDVVELRKKLRLIENLIREYATLSENEKTKVQTVHDYLAKQLDMLLEYIDAKEDAEKKGKSSLSMEAPNGPRGRILQYQTGIKNATNGSYLREPGNFSPFMDVPNFLKLSNTAVLENKKYPRDNGIDFRHKGRRTVRSLGKQAKQRKKHRKRRKHKKKHRKRHKGASAIHQSGHKGTARKATASRHKRGYLDKDFWDSLDSGYEEPPIYSSMDMANVAAGGRELLNGMDNLGDKGVEKARKWKDVVGGVDKNYLTKRKEIDGKRENNELSRSSNSMRKREASGTMKNLSDSESQSGSRAVADKRVTGSASNPEKGSNLNKNDKNSLTTEEEQPITGKNRVEDEVILLNKRQAWKKENEEQLEEVAFGEDMRKGVWDKVLFEKLTEMDKNRGRSESNGRGERANEQVEDGAPLVNSSTGQENYLTQEQTQECSCKDCAASDRNGSHDLSKEDRLRTLEGKINVYSDNDRDTQLAR